MVGLVVNRDAPHNFLFTKIVWDSDTKYSAVDARIEERWLSLVGWPRIKAIV